MASLAFDQPVVTPSGTPLGGWVHLDASETGDYHVKFHMHSSGVFGDFDFNLRAYLTAPGFPTMVFVHNGHVSGVDDADYEEQGSSPLLALYWEQLQASPGFQVAKDYSWSGVIGTIDDLLKDVLDLGAAVIGETLGVVIGATREAMDWLGTTLGPGGTLGVIGGVVVFAVAVVAGAGVGAALVLAVVAGVAIGAVTDALVDYRALHDDEKALARQVFGDSLPFDDVVITNLAGLGGRAFTAPGIDGKTYCNLGSGYDNPLGPGGNAYPYPGQLLIHELTHAWQIAHSGWLPGLMCSGIVNQADYTMGDNVYDFGEPDRNWDVFQAEQQGAIVDQWFGGNHHSSGYKPLDQQNVYYRYIWDNILQQVPEPTAPATLRQSSGGSLAASVARFPNDKDTSSHLDVFWVGPDGRIASAARDTKTGDTWGLPHDVAPPGAAAAGAVAGLSRVLGHVDIVWIGPDGGVGTNWWDAAAPGGWGQPYPIAPPGAAAPGGVACVSRFPNHLDVFWIGPDGGVGTNWWDAAAAKWGDPYPIAPPGAAAPGGVACVSRFPNHLDVFWIGPDGGVGTNWWDAAAAKWGDPYPIAPPGAAAPGGVACVSRFPNHLDVFWIGPDGGVGTNWWDAAAAKWGDPYPIAPPGAAAPGGVACVSRFPNHLDVFWIGPDGGVGTNWWDAAAAKWGDPYPIAPPGAAAPRGITCVSHTPQTLEVFWVGFDGSVTGTRWDGSSGGTWSSE